MNGKKDVMQTAFVHQWGASHGETRTEKQEQKVLVAVHNTLFDFIEFLCLCTDEKHWRGKAEFEGGCR